VALPLFLATAAFAWSAGAGPLAVMMLALTLATLGIYAAIGTFWTLLSSVLTGTGAAAGLALINSIGNCGVFVGPLAVGCLKGATGNFTAALLFLACGPALHGVLALSFGQIQLNYRRAVAPPPRIKDS
jgi:MFS transporter, ACS family, tartrate transporter